jgi:exodeoxyribonuclease VII large subunit
LGELYERFLKLKEELEERGLFAEEYKKPLPSSPRVIGVVTAPTGAAVRDIISVAKGRDPYVQILLFPAIVQGQSAVPSIVRGIKLLDKAGVDVIIVGRGGGSLEDLWAFNEEEVAQAIFDCDTPVISAVGHETDTTIADFVADVRAETPTAAAVLATIDRIAYDNYLEGSKKTLDRAIGYAIEREKNRIRARADRLNLLSPQSRINTYRHRSALATDRLQNAMDKALAENKKRMSVAAERLNGVSPLLKLSQGYSYTEDSEGRRVSSVDRVKSGERIKVYVRDGQIDATVDAVSRQADS